MWLTGSKKLYLPAFSIIAVVCLLMLLIGISTYRNLDREKRRVLAAVHHQGVALLRALEAGARSGMMVHSWEEDTVAVLIREVARDRSIAYIYLADPAGRIVHHSDDGGEGEKTDWNPGAFRKDWVNSRMKTLDHGGHVYELAKPFLPAQPAASVSGNHPGTAAPARPSPHGHAGDVIVLGIRMGAFEKARQADIHHALIMAGIVLVLGSGVLFFIFVIQNYYLVERTLGQARDYTRRIVDSMANGLLSTDARGKIIAYNRLGLEMLGLQAADVRGKDLSALLDPDSVRRLDPAGSGRTVRDREIEIIRPDGVPVSLSISTSPMVEESGDRAGLVVLLRDLGEIKKLEEKVRRSEKLAAIGNLAAGIAHEIRNPLSSIRGFAQFLHHALKDRPRDREYAAIMITEMDRINRVVSDLLSFASPRPAKPEPTDLDRIVSHVTRLVAADAASKDIRIDTRVSPGLASLSLDAHQITQALLNLLLNALKFTESGGRILVAAERNKKKNGLMIIVEDDGVGIPHKQMASIFDPFFTTRETGTGLGLGIVHQIVENHQGSIEVASPAPGKERGTRFTIRLPILPDAEI